MIGVLLVMRILGGNGTLDLTSVQELGAEPLARGIQNKGQCNQRNNQIDERIHYMEARKNEPLSV